jgi:hypothetical protein
MALQNIQLRAGVVRETTSYSNEGGWFDVDKVRFRYGVPEKIGGWEKYSGQRFDGACRSMHIWVALDGSDYVGLGTNLKFYIEKGGTLNNVTPIRRTVVLTADALTTASGTKTVTVVDNLHGAVANDFVTFSGVSSAIGGVPASDFNREHQIVSVLDSNSYTITVLTQASSTASGSGGDSFTAVYQINTGLNTVVGGTGWGAGLWSGVTDGAIASTLNGAISSTSSTSNITLVSTTGFGNATATTLTADLDAGVTSMTVADASTFPEEGSVLIGSEVIKYESGGIDGNVIANLTRGAFGTTDTDHSSGAGVAYQGVVLIDNELITYSGISGSDLTGIARGKRGTSGATHDNGSTVRDARDFVGWGDASPTTVTSEIRLWYQDNFGEDLLYNVRDGAIYYWDKSDGLLTAGVALSSVTGANKVPTVAKQVMVSDRDRHVIAFGCDPEGSTVQDPLLIRFSDQESITDWQATTNNSAGELRIGSGSRFVRAIETKREILVWTDTSLHSMTFIGAPFTFGITQLSANTTIIGPNAAAAVDDLVFWMGRETFYMYDGRVQQLPCAVKQKVFGDLNLSQNSMIFAGVNSEFTEIIWFYPSSGSSDDDKYVIYNYGEKLWYYGDLARTAWVDRGIRTYPQATGTTSEPYIFNHELGTDADGSAITAYIESSQFDIGDGEKFSFVSRVIPDITFNGSSATNPTATFTIKARNYPGASYDQSQNGAVTRSSTSPVEQFTNEFQVRVRGRSIALRVESSTVGTAWRLGTPRLEMRTDGRR